jgi:membrane fusion protein, copper/silver efflux system
MESDHKPDDLLEGEEKAPPGARAMAFVRWALVGLMALAAVGSMLYYFDRLPGSGAATRAARRYYCPMHPAVTSDQPGDCPICSMSLVPFEGSAPPKVAAAPAGHQHASKVDDAAPYVCPMHPEETSADANARCKLCKMKLEPRKVAPGSEHVGHQQAAPTPATPAVPGVTAVDLPEGRVQLIGMKTATVTRQTLTPELRTVGYVAVNERGQASINTRFSGWIEKLSVNQTGERVGRGQILATIYSPQLFSAQQDLLNARRWATGGGGSGEGLDEAARHRLELLGISDKEIAEVVRTGRALRAIPVRSPVSGYVTVKSALQGVFVQPGTQLFEVADLSTVWVIADVYEYEAGRVHLGQEAHFELAAYPGERFAGKVRFIYPSLDPNTRTLRLRVELRNPALRLKPGMFGTAMLHLSKSEGLVVPKEAVIDTGEAQYTFVARPGGRFEPRALRLGTRTEDKVQVLAGLGEGETVVTTGNFLIDSESRLRSAIEGFAPQGEGVGGVEGQTRARAPRAGGPGGHQP